MVLNKSFPQVIKMGLQEGVFYPCNTCEYKAEAHFLMFDLVNTTLNTRDEYFNACPHKKKYLLLKG